MANFLKNENFLPSQPSIITILNRQKVILEGVKRIIFCDSEKMIIKNRFVTEISGQNLRLLELGNDNIAVVGKIQSLYFDRAEK